MERFTQYLRDHEPQMQKELMEPSFKEKRKELYERLRAAPDEKEFRREFVANAKARRAEGFVREQLATVPHTWRDTKEDAMRAFRQFDLDHCGKISFDNLKQVARELGENMTDEEIWEMIQAGDVDKDGMINEDEFLRVLKKGLAA